MKKLLLFNLLAFAMLLFAQTTVLAQGGVAFPDKSKIPGIIIVESGKIENHRVLAKHRMKAGGEPTAQFVVNYNGFSDEAKTAFQAAVDEWSYLISSTVPIIIEATWEPMDIGVLGGARSASYRRNFRNAPNNDVWYPIAIANKNAGYDIEPESSDIIASFSSNSGWYLGTDGNCPSNLTDFMTVVMHEIGHGLGFAGSGGLNPDNNALGQWGRGTSFPFVYDLFVYNGQGQLLIDTLLFANNSVELKNEYTSGDIYFVSDLGNAANGGEQVELYAPSTWNQGSSYSHLGEVFNNTDHAMMTYSVGGGEVIHYPGDVTLAMFAEMGWMNVLFEHEPLKDMESFEAPINITAKISADSSIVEGSIKLHYSADNFTTDNEVVMKNTTDNVFEAQIPVLDTDSLFYYLEATTAIGRTYYLPSQGTGVNAEVTNTFRIAIGEDTIAPIVVHTPEQSIFNFHENLEVVFGANDNLGLSTSFIEYKVNEGGFATVTPTLVEYDIEEDLYVYSSNIYVGDLVDADTVYYRIIVNDAAQVTNTTILPEDGLFKVSILDLGEPIVEAFIDFDEADHMNMFIDNGLSIEDAGFATKGLHSPHPYEEGDPYPTDELNYTSYLKNPVILKQEKSYLRYDEIVLVEPGQPGSSFGDSDFWDYVIIEGSVDSAKTWQPMVDGYDCNISVLFANAYNNQEDGTEAMYLSHVVNLLENGNFNGGDTVLIRFRLYSDQLSVGWGWALDNLEIQPTDIAVNEPVFNAKFKVYPNPTSGSFDVYVASIDGMDEYELAVYNVLGERVYHQAKLSSTTHKVNLDGAKSGIYFVKVNQSGKTLTKKIVIE